MKLRTILVAFCMGMSVSLLAQNGSDKDLKETVALIKLNHEILNAYSEIFTPEREVEVISKLLMFQSDLKVNKRWLKEAEQELAQRRSELSATKEKIVLAETTHDGVGLVGLNSELVVKEREKGVALSLVHRTKHFLKLKEDEYKDFLASVIGQYLREMKEFREKYKVEDLIARHDKIEADKFFATYWRIATPTTLEGFAAYISYTNKLTQMFDAFWADKTL